MNNNIFTIKYNKSLMLRMFSFVVIVLSIASVLYVSIGCILFVLTALFFIAQNPGFQIDFENKKYRNTNMIGDHSFGNWQKLPGIKYITVFKTVITGRVYGMGATSTRTKEEVILVNFVYSKNKRLTAYKTNNIEDAFEKAVLFSKKLNLKIFDATSKDKKWININ